MSLPLESGWTFVTALIDYTGNDAVTMVTLD